MKTGRGEEHHSHHGMNCQWRILVNNSAQPLFIIIAHSDVKPGAWDQFEIETEWYIKLGLDKHLLKLWCSQKTKPTTTTS
jgi:hypothetical protein